MEITGDLFPFAKDANGHLRQQVTCKQCARTDHNTVTGKPASEKTLLAYFRRRGWTINERTRDMMCRPCERAKAEQRRKTKEQMKMAKKPDTEKTPVVPSPDNVLAKKLVSDLLFDNYDLSIRNYKPGWSDERIAGESKLSVDFVKARRVADYGEMAPLTPPFADQAFSELECARQSAADAMDHLHKAIHDANSALACMTNLISHSMTAQDLIVRSEREKNPGYRKQHDFLAG